MRTANKILLLALIFVMILTLISCSAATGDYSMGDSYVSGAPSHSEDSSSSEEGEDANEKPDETVTLPAGMITAGAWMDNDNYQMWLDLFAQKDEEHEQDGKFYGYTIGDYDFGFNSLKRVSVSVTCGGEAVAGAKVIAYDTDGNTLFTAISNAQGKAYVFTDALEGTVEVSSGDGVASAPFSAQEREINVELDTKAEKLNVIEIMFIVDVTGSMGDEISFLKTELADVIKKIAENNEGAVIRLALLFYRDNDDQVPFDYYDFVNVTDTEGGLSAQLDALKKQSATGGGDYPEAVDEALEMAVNKQWSTGNATKLIFHVLDAPIHTGTKYEKRFGNAVYLAAQKGIRINPIICSGASDFTEYTMREAAIHTGGTFIFVTDDSGIGNSHHDPDLPNVTVELLNSMIVRLVNGYHSGEFEDPVYWKDDPNLGLQQ